ncbi:MAG: Gfo/Idh/MocA family oxidoreductase [Ignavibacteria bacterium]|nr:Gfo/Idh/MocA family oxidoreductase [Ignavibacteria bacterium]
MEKIKVAVIGAGWISQIIHLPILKKMNDVEIVAICDREKTKAKSVASRFGISRSYSDYTELLKTEDCSCVIICTSTDAHKEHAIASLESGNDVFVEKPLARKYSEASDIVAVATNTKRKLMVGMNNRFRPDTMVLRGIIEAGEIGKIYYVKAGWLKKMNADSRWMTKKEKSGGGVFLDLGIVMLDLTLWMTGYPGVRRVSASMYKHNTRSVEDSCILWCQMNNSTTISVEVSWAFHTEEDYFYCDLIGTNGSASINPLCINRNIDGQIVHLTPMKHDTPQHQYYKSYENELKHFLQAVRGLHPIVSTGAEALQRMEVVEAIYRSAQLGKEQHIK